MSAILIIATNKYKMQTNMNKHMYILLVIACIIISCDKKVSNDNLDVIEINVESVVDKLDISSIFQDSIEIIPLETSNTSLISDIEKVIFQDGLLYISDRMGQAIFVFNQFGEFITSIGELGPGPNEYSELGDFILVGDSILVQDKYSNKILIYNREGVHQSNIDLPDLTYAEFTCFDNKLIFVTNHERSDFGYYNLVTYDLATKKFNTFIPYPETIPSPWALSAYTSVYKESLLFILPRNNKIYGVHKSEVMPQYNVSFSSNNVPLELLEKNGSQVLIESHEKGYILGLDRILNTGNYIFGTYGEGAIPRELLFDKRTKKSQICNWFILGDIGELYISNYITTDNDDFVFLQDADMFMTAWENIYSKKAFRSEEVKDRMQTAYNSMKEDANPIVFRMKFRER